MLSLETCLKLKEAGWPQEHRVNLGHGYYNHKRGPNDGPMAMWSVDQWPIDGFVFLCAQPTLEELLEAVVKALPGGYTLEWNLVEYRVCGIHRTLECYAPSPSEAVAALWLKLKEVKQ